MKPNDKAYQAARAAILKAMAERNCIIAGVTFNENNYDEFDAGEAVEHSKVAVDAAYAAQLPPSEDYAELIKALRSSSPYRLSHVAADALEALLAERDALKDELDKAQEIARVQAERIGYYINEQEKRDAVLKPRKSLAESAAKERDALLARLAPVEDEAMLKAAAQAICDYVYVSPDDKFEFQGIARAAIAAIRPHIEAAERERCAKRILETNWVDADPEEIAAAIRSWK